MPRVKRGNQRTKKRKKVLQNTKGYKWRRKNVYKLAREAENRALERQYVGRKQKKRDKRTTWQVKISAASRNNGLSYSKFIHGLKQNGIELDRKVLADIAENEPETFQKIVEKVNK